MKDNFDSHSITQKLHVIYEGNEPPVKLINIPNMLENVRKDTE